MPTGAAPTILAGISHVGSQGLLASLGAIRLEICHAFSLCIAYKTNMICGETGRERERGVSIFIMGITSSSMPHLTKTMRRLTFLVKVHWFYLPPSCSKDGSPFVRGHLQGWFPNDLDLVWNREDNNCRLVCWTAMGEVQETQFDTGPVR